jgi:hypothetical protein
VEARMNLGIVGGGVTAGGSGEFGTLTIGESTSGRNGDIGLCAKLGAAPQTGKVDKIIIYSAQTTTQNIEVGLYADNGSDLPGAIVGSETHFTDTGTWSAGWHEFAVDYSITQGVIYWACSRFSADGYITMYYGGTGAGNQYSYDVGFGGDIAWLSTWASSGAGAELYSIKAHYTY